MHTTMTHDGTDASSPAIARWFVSAVVITVLGAQTVIGFMSSMNHFFPIMNYPMYSHPHYDGDRLVDYSLHAILPDGTAELIAPEDIGMNYWTFRANVIDRLIDKGDMRSVQPLIASLCEKRGLDAETLRVADIGVSVSRHGAVHGEPAEITVVTLDCPN